MRKVKKYMRVGRTDAGKWLLPLLIGFCFILSGCRQSETREEFFAMDTVMSVTAYGSGSEKAVQEAKAKIYQLDSLLSVNSTSGETAFSAGKERILSEDTFSLLGSALKAAELTRGAYDPTVGMLTGEWGFASDTFTVPEAGTIEACLKCTGWEKVHLLDGGTVRTDTDIQLDFGGIAKGYACACVRQILREHGVTSGLIVLGGNVSCVGSKNGGMWNIGLMDPEDNTLSFMSVKVKDAAVVTSGNYLRQRESDGTFYGHILSAQTGYPAQTDLISVTIVSQDDTMADALSTALFAMGSEEAIRFYRSGALAFEAVLMDENRHVWVTEGLEKQIQTRTAYELIR